MSGLYLVVLLGGLACMVLIDRRYRLFFWRSPGRAAIVLGVGVAFLLVWDLVGIDLGLFRRGDSDAFVGLMIAPELPVEEVFFLAFLCYLTMNLVEGFVRSARREDAQDAPDERLEEASRTDRQREGAS